MRDKRVPFDQGLMVLSIRCPSTGKPLGTGLLMTQTSFDMTPLEDGQVKCPHCGEVHAWSKKDIFLRPAMKLP